MQWVAVITQILLIREPTQVRGGLKGEHESHTPASSCTRQQLPMPQGTRTSRATLSMGCTHTASSSSWSYIHGKSPRRPERVSPCRVLATQPGTLWENLSSDTCGHSWEFMDLRGESKGLTSLPAVPDVLGLSNCRVCGPQAKMTSWGSAETPPWDCRGNGGAPYLGCVTEIPGQISGR